MLHWHLGTTVVGAGAGGECLYCADILFPWAGEWAEPQHRADEVQMASVEVGLAFSDSSFESVRNECLDRPRELRLTRTTQRFAYVSTMHVLGILFGANGIAEVFDGHRERDAWKVWHRHTLVCALTMSRPLSKSHVSTQRRAPAPYGCSLWAPSAALRRRVDALELRLLHQVMGAAQRRLG